MDEDKKFELMMRDKADLSDTELAELVVAMNEPTKVPPCRVCGAELQPGSAGGGMPTEYRCSSDAAQFLNFRFGTKEHDVAYEHYTGSVFQDRRHVDPWAYELAFRIVNLSEA